MKKMDVFSSTEFATLQGGQNISGAYRTEGVFWVKVQNITPYFMALIDDKSNLVGLVAPCAVSTLKLTEEVSTLTVTSRNDLPQYTPTGMTQSMWRVYLELCRDEPPHENYKFL